MTELPTSLDISGILKVLPHRYPFALVDSVEKIDRPTNSKSVGQTIVAYKNVTINEPYFTGHFPEHPIMPGVLIIESLAQACGLLAYKEHPEGKAWTFYILGISKAKFRKPVIPGDRLRLECTLIKDKGAVVAFQCKAYSGDELKTEAEILAQMKP